MKNLFALIGLAVVLVGGLGWYLGWYRIGAEPAGPGHTKFNVDVNRDQISNDLKKGQQKISDIINSKGTPQSQGSQKQVEGTPTGLRESSDGSFIITPPKITSLPPLPSFEPIEQLNPDSPKKVIPPPPPSFKP